jgi:hypothetical protein
VIGGRILPEDASPVQRFSHRPSSQNSAGEYSRAQLSVAGVGATFRRTVNLTVLSARANREFAVRLTALERSRVGAERQRGQQQPTLSRCSSAATSAGQSSCKKVRCAENSAAAPKEFASVPAIAAFFSYHACQPPSFRRRLHGRRPHRRTVALLPGTRGGIRSGGRREVRWRYHGLYRHSADR